MAQKRLFEHLYARLGEHQGDGIKPREEFAAELTYVNITPAALWFYEDSDQEEFDMRDDFPCVTPPWNPLWMEFTFRKSVTIKTSGQVCSPQSVGVVIRSFRFEDRQVGRDAFQIDVLPRYLGAQIGNASRDLYEKRRRIIEHTLNETEIDPTWLFAVELFQAVGSSSPQPVGRFGTYLGQHGQIIHGELSLIAAAPLLVQGHLASGLATSTEEAMYNAANVVQSTLYPFLFALSLMHCKNVEIIDEPAPVQYSRKKRKQKGMELTFKTLSIEPMRKQVRRASGEMGPGGGTIKRALHIIRGHFKDYRDGAGLFGKHKDIFWWEQHVRGDLASGAIIKDYEVLAPTEPCLIQRV